MTRILFLIDELDVGGTEQQILELVKRLDRRRYQPVVCCFRPGRKAAEMQAQAAAASAAGAVVSENPTVQTVLDIFGGRVERVEERSREE